MLGEINLVSQIFSNLAYDDLIKCREVLDNAINKSFTLKRKELHSKLPTDYITYNDSFLDRDSVEYAGLCAELEDLHLTPKGNNPATKWVTTTNQPYTWESSAGTVTVKNPIDIGKYPFINQLMKDISTKYDADLNSALVSYYKTGSVKLRYHDDGEDTMDPNQPICVLSIGAQRTCDFLYQDQDHRERPVHTVKPVDGSLYIMKPGCQQYFKHRVKTEYNVTGYRYCLSFRRMIPKGEPSASTTSTSSQPTTTLSSPVKQLINQYEAGTPFVEIQGEVNHQQQQQQQQQQHVPHTQIDPRFSMPRKKRTTVLFGTSMTTRLLSNKLVNHRRTGRKIINISRSGAKIRDILHNVEYFHHNSPDAADVEKIIFSFGTNDIKYSRRGILHLKQVIIDLINKTKYMFPDCIILVQCCLPMRNLYWYTCRNVNEFNKLLSNICKDNNCIFIDCFNYFLSRDGMDYNYDLYYDWLHLNDVGLGVLAKCLSSVINQNSYNHVFNHFWAFNNVV